MRPPRRPPRQPGAAVRPAGWTALQGEATGTKEWGHLIERLTGDLHSLYWSNLASPTERAAARAVLEGAWAGGLISSWADMATVFLKIEAIGADGPAEAPREISEERDMNYSNPMAATGLRRADGPGNAALNPFDLSDDADAATAGAVIFGCETCMFGAANRNSESGWVCTIDAVMRCRPHAQAPALHRPRLSSTEVPRQPHLLQGEKLAKVSTASGVHDH